MRAVFVFSVIVVALLVGLAALSISRAECEKPKEATEAASTAEPKETAKPDATDSDSTPQLAVEASTTKESSTDTVTHLSPNEVEHCVGSTFMDEELLWGDRVNWSQLKSHPITEGPLSFQSFAVCERNQTDVTENWIGSSQQDRMAAGKAYHEAARQLDSIANDLEEARLYHDADAVRAMVQKLRVRARLLPWDSREETNERFIFGGVGIAR